MRKLEFANNFVNANDILDRLKFLLNLHSDAELARFLEVNPSTVATWRAKNSMKLDRIIEYTSNIDLNWLFRKKEFNHSNNYDINEIEKEQPVHSVNYYHTIKMDSNRKVIFMETDELINFCYPKSLIDNAINSEPNDFFITHAIGDTMEPTICNRDFLIIQKNCAPPYSGQIYLMLIDGMVQCKRLNEYPNNKLLIMNDNDRYENILIDPKETDFKIIGRVIAYSRSI